MVKKTFKPKMDPYFKEIEKYPLLTPEEEQRLGKELYDLNKTIENIIISTPYGKSFYLDIDEKVKSRGRKITSYMDCKQEQKKELCTKEFNDFIRALKENKSPEEAWLCLNQSWFQPQTKEEIQKQFYDKLQEYAKTSNALPRMRVRRTYKEIAFHTNCQKLFDMDANKLIANYEKFTTLEQRLVKIVNKVAESNLRLVIAIAKQYNAKGFSFLDLVQEGNEGLLKRVKYFDYRKDVKMITYLSSWISAGIRRAIADTSSTITVPVYVRNDINNVNKFMKKHPHINLENYKAHIEEISKGIRLNPKRIIQAFESKNLMFTPSLEKTLRNTDNTNLKDMFEDKEGLIPGEGLEIKEIGGLIIKTIKGMKKKRESFVLLARYWKPMTLDDIGKNIFNVSRERIRQIEAKAFKSFERDFIENIKSKCGISDSSAKRMFKSFSYDGNGTENEAEALYNELLPEMLEQAPKERSRRPKTINCYKREQTSY